MKQRVVPSIFNLFFCFSPIRIDSGDPQAYWEDFYSRY